MVVRFGVGVGAGNVEKAEERAAEKRQAGCIGYFFTEP
jgi:hypothetical protein